MLHTTSSLPVLDKLPAGDPSWELPRRMGTFADYRPASSTHAHSSDSCRNEHMGDPGRPFQHAEIPGGNVGEIGMFADRVEDIRPGVSLIRTTVTPGVDTP